MHAGKCFASVEFFALGGTDNADQHPQSAAGAGGGRYDGDRPAKNRLDGSRDPRTPRGPGIALTEAQARAAAQTTVDNYALDAPAELRTAAVEMVELSMWDAPYDNETWLADQVRWTHDLHANVIQCCGASSIAVAWRRSRARVIEGASA